MKNASHTILFCSVLLLPVMTMAANRMVTEDMQKCTQKEQCALVSEDCGTACATLPVNVNYVSNVQQYVMQQCENPHRIVPECTVIPELTADCVNNRCTIGTAYISNGDAGDYETGSPATSQ